MQSLGYLLSLFFDLFESLFFVFFELSSVLIFLFFGSQSHIENLFVKETAVSQGYSNISTQLGQPEIVHTFIDNNVGNVHTFLGFFLWDGVAVFANLLRGIFQRELKCFGSDSLFQGESLAQHEVFM